MLDQAPSQQVLRDVIVRGRARRAGRARRSVGRRQDDDQPRSCRGCTTSAAARCGSTASTCATPRSTSIRRTIGVVTQDAHLFHDTIRANLLYAKPDATEEELIDALRAAQILPLIESLPDGLDTVVGDRGYRLSGGEKQRIAIARLLLKAPDDRRARRGDRPPRLGIGGRGPAGASRPRSPGAPRSSSRTGSRPSARRTRSWSSTTATSSSAARTPSCSPPAGSTPSSTETQFAAQATAGEVVSEVPLEAVG